MNTSSLRRRFDRRTWTPGRLRLLPAVAAIALIADVWSPVNGIASEVIRIAAIVNDEIISVFDLENRIRLVAATSNLPNRPDVMQRLESQVLRAMIDERLQLQEAERFNVRIGQQEINSTIAGLEKQNNMQRGELVAFLQSRGVDRAALENQIRARLSWLKLVNRKLMREVTVGQDEVKEELNRLKSLQGKPRMHVFEIFLSVDSSEQEQQLQQTAERLVGQIAAGARFQALAREFSQSTSAANGGDLGWVTDGELSDELATTLQRLQPGQISQPVRTLTGFHILYLAERRTGIETSADDITIGHRQLLLPLPTAALPSEVESQARLADEIAKTVNSCDEFLQAGRNARAERVEQLQVTTAGSFPAALRDMVVALAIGKPSSPIRTPDGFLIVIVCSRTQSDAGLPTAEAIEERLQREKLDLMVQRYLRDLRRSAYVDLRQ